VIFGADGQQIATSSDHKVQVWDSVDGENIATLDLDFELRGDILAFDSGGNYLLITGSQEGSTVVVIWEIDTNRTFMVTPEENSDYADWLWSNPSAILSPDGLWLAVVNGIRVQIWSVTSGEKVVVVENSIGNIEGIAFSPDGKWLVTIASGVIQVWDVTTGQEQSLSVLEEQYDESWSTPFSPNGQRVISIGENVQIWDVFSGQEIASIKGEHFMGATGVVMGVASAVFSPDGKWIMTNGPPDTDTTTRFYPATIETLIEIAQQRATRKLTCQERVTYLREELNCNDEEQSTGLE
jgi:WD40 repeat protein